MEDPAGVHYRGGEESAMNESDQLIGASFIRNGRVVAKMPGER